MSCPLCASRLPPLPVHRIGQAPVTCTSVFDSADEARAVGTGTVELVACVACGFAWNAAFDERIAMLGAAYDSSQAASAHFVAFAEALARDWTQRHGLAGRTVIEAGCGGGDFLRAMRRAGVARAIGIDPLAGSTDAGRSGTNGRSDTHGTNGTNSTNGTRGENDTDGTSNTHGPAHTRADDTPEYRVEPLAEHHAALEASALICRHTLEHVPDPRAFLALVRLWAVREPGRVVLFELPASEALMEAGAFWDVYYEHCNYFTAATLRALFEATGFEILRCERAYGGQYLLLEARAVPGADPVPAPRAARAPADAPPDLAQWARFGDGAGRAIERCRQGFAALAHEGRPLVIWQGAAKTVGVLTACGPIDGLVCAVDANPSRHGRHLPGSGLPVVSPEALRSLPPAEVVLMNPVYRAEVRASLDAISPASRLHTVDAL